MTCATLAPIQARAVPALEVAFPHRLIRLLRRRFPLVLRLAFLGRRRNFARRPRSQDPIPAALRFLRLLRFRPLALPFDPFKTP